MVLMHVHVVVDVAVLLLVGVKFVVFVFSVELVPFLWKVPFSPALRRRGSVRGEAVGGATVTVVLAPEFLSL